MLKKGKIQLQNIETFTKNEKFLKDYVLSFKVKIVNLIDIYNFIPRNLRCTYVNERSVSWKITIFARDKMEAVMILTRLCDLIDKKIDPRLFTCSDIRLANEQENNIVVYLHKVSLLINKKKYPIIVSHI